MLPLLGLEAVGHGRIERPLALRIGRVERQPVLLDAEDVWRPRGVQALDHETVASLNIVRLDPAGQRAARQVQQGKIRDIVDMTDLEIAVPVQTHGLA